PENAEPLLRLGDTLALAGSLDEAIAAWERGIAQFDRPTIKATFLARLADFRLRAGQLQPTRAAIEAIDPLLAELGGLIPRHEHLGLLQAQGVRRARYALLSGRFSDAGA